MPYSGRYKRNYRRGYGRRRPTTTQRYQRAVALTYPRMASANRAPLSTRGFSGSPIEKKYFQGTFDFNFDKNSFGFGTLFTPASGSGIDQRVGRKVTITNIHLLVNLYPRYWDYNDATTPPPDGWVAPQTGRVSLVWDSQVNSTTVDVTVVPSVYNNPDYGAAAQVNLDNRERFKILKTKTFHMGGYYKDSTTDVASTALTENPVWTFKFHKKCNLDVIFSGDSGSISNIATGGLYLICTSDSKDDGMVNHTGVRCKGSSRCRFIDP